MTCLISYVSSCDLCHVLSWRWFMSCFWDLDLRLCTIDAQNCKFETIGYLWKPSPRRSQALKLIKQVIVKE